MKQYHLSTPIRPEDVKDITIGDIVYLDGLLVTGRDDVHQRVVKQGKPSPVDLEGGAIFHAGPIMKPIGTKTDADGNEVTQYQVISIGPTTSMRMNAYEAEYIEKTGVRLIVGKGGMGDKTVEGCKKGMALHTVFPGGCAVLAAKCVEEVSGVEWLDLGMPEAMWVMKVKNFGPLIVSIDTKGGNLFENNKKIFNERKGPIVERISKEVDFLD
ncbi:MAG TPA: L(+)-tartrate dehydratase subunit beta [Bacillota bacterium]|nr:L(+)-tartrate dehydratase subunit beta [Bacillota bacterium]HPE38946.1 L(+)-tartrate dehydratase subunit beta [Bacillota bacterium]